MDEELKAMREDRDEWQRACLGACRALGHTTSSDPSDAYIYEELSRKWAKERDRADVLEARLRDTRDELYCTRQEKGEAEAERLNADTKMLAYSNEADELRAENTRLREALEGVRGHITENLVSGGVADIIVADVEKALANEPGEVSP